MARGGGGGQRLVAKARSNDRSHGQMDITQLLRERSCSCAFKILRVACPSSVLKIAMGSEWQQENVDVHELDLAIASEGSHLLWNNHGDVMDGLVGAENNVDNTEDAAADDDHDSRGASENHRETAHKRFKRHSNEQTKELEAVFKACPNPDERLRLELSKRIGMEALQVKYWFQNRRSQKKAQLERQEGKALRGENEMLRSEYLAMREAMLKKTCTKCGGLTVLAEETPEQRRLRMENARLKDEILHTSAFLKKLSRKPEVAPLPVPSRPSAVPCYGLALVGTGGALVLDSFMMPLPSAHPASALKNPILSVVDGSVLGRVAANGHTDRSALLRHVDRAMEEFMMLVKKGEPMWFPTADGEVLNDQLYTAATFPGLLGLRPMGFVLEGTRETGMVMGTAADLVGILTDAARWSEMFSGVVAGATSSDVFVSGGTAGASRDGLIQLMNAELRVLSPRVPPRNIKILRRSKLLESGQWAVVDVSIDGILGQDDCGTVDGYTACRLLPTGCLIEDMNNGYCKVTWIVNAEYDETTVPQLYHPLLRSGQALGARRWLASLQRRCEYLAILRSDPAPSLNDTAISPEGRRSVLELAQRMMASFYAAMCGPVAQMSSNVQEWHGSSGAGTERFDVAVRVVTLPSGGSAPGEQAGLVLSATTTVWLPGTPVQRVFDYLCNGERRADWDTLANGAGVEEEGFVTTGQLQANAVSVLRPNAADGTRSNQLILQEVCTDASCSLVVYSPIDEQPMRTVMNGGGHASVSILSSGFAVLPDGHSEPRVPPVAAQSSSSAPISHNNSTGSLVTAMYQKLLSGLPSENLAEESVDNIGKLLCRAIERIKAAVKADVVVTA